MLNKVKYFQNYLSAKHIPVNLWFAIFLWIAGAITNIFKYSSETTISLISLPCLIVLMFWVLHMLDDVNSFQNEISNMTEEDLHNWFNDKTNE